MNNSFENKKPTRLFKHLHSIWSISLRGKSDKEAYTQKRSVTSESKRPIAFQGEISSTDRKMVKLADFKQQTLIVSESDSSISICQSPLSPMNLRRENSLSLMSPNRDTEESSNYENSNDESEIESLNTHEKSDKMPYDNMMLNNNESQNTLLCDYNPKMSSKAVRQRSFKRRDLAPTILTQKAKLRRTHSMFTSTNEVEIRNTRIPIYDSRLEISKLPIHYEEHSSDNLPRITVETLLQIMNDDYSKFYQEVYIVDCRFQYEFLGGHIKDAINISKQKQLEEEFIHKRHIRCCDSERPPLIVFHCEFSSYRGPIMASHLRTCDRIINHDNYPKLHFPDVVVLDGGFKTFYEKYPNKCEGHYVCMDSKNHELELSEFKRDSKKLMTRANSTQIFQLKDKIGTCPVSLSDVNNDYNIPLPNKVPTEEHQLTNEQNIDYDEEASYFNFSINVPPKLCLDRYGEGSPNNGSNSSKSSSLSTSSRLLFSDEIGTEFKPKFLEHEESDLDSDGYSFQFGDDDTDDRMSNITGKKRLFPELVNANK